MQQASGVPPASSAQQANRIALASASLAVLFCAWLVLLHLRMIVSPAPQEMREGAAVWITRLLLEGRNPYAVAELPASANVYGILYYLVVVPFARVFGNSFPLHRIVSGVSILGACLIVYGLLRQRQTDRVLAAVGVVLFYASSVYFVAPLARPDSLGLLLSVASLALLFREKPTTIAFVAGLSLAVMALATKPYLAYPPFVLAAYTFVYRSRARGLVYGLTSVMSAGLLLAVLSAKYPAYLSLTFAANANTGYGDASHLLRQTRDWLVFSLPLAVGLVLVAGEVTRGPARLERLRRADIFAFAGAANAVVFLAWLGWHPGAHMTYAFQLVTPALILALLPHLGRRPWPRAAVAAALPVACLMNAHYFPMTFSRFDLAEASFARLDAAIAVHREVLGSTEVAGLLALEDRPVVDSGQSEYVREAIVDWHVRGLVPAPALQARWDWFMDTLNQRLRAEQFDLVVRSRRNGLIPRELVRQHYVNAGTVDIEFGWSGQAWPIDLWEPRHARASRP